VTEEGAMPTYITLCRWPTTAVAEEVARLLRATEYRRAVEAAGGRLLSVSLTHGAYDAILTTEWPDAAAAASGLPQMECVSDGRTQTLRVLSSTDVRGLGSPAPAAG
jgi:uncharacterized protein with GYD domain